MCCLILMFLPYFVDKQLKRTFSNLTNILLILTHFSISISVFSSNFDCLMIAS